MMSSTSACPSCASGSKWRLVDCQRNGECCADQFKEAWTTSARCWKFARGCTPLKSPKTKRMTALLRWKDKLQSLLEWRTSMSMLWKTSKKAPMASFQSFRILSSWLCFLTSLEALPSVNRSAMALWRRDQEGRPTTSSAMALKSTESAMVKSKAFRTFVLRSIDRSPFQTPHAFQSQKLHAQCWSPHGPLVPCRCSVGRKNLLAHCCLCEASAATGAAWRDKERSPSFDHHVQVWIMPGKNVLQCCYLCVTLEAE